METEIKKRKGDHFRTKNGVQSPFRSKGSPPAKRSKTGPKMELDLKSAGKTENNNRYK